MSVSSKILFQLIPSLTGANDNKGKHNKESFNKFSNRTVEITLVLIFLFSSTGKDTSKASYPCADCCLLQSFDPLGVLFYISFKPTSSVDNLMGYNGRASLNENETNTSKAPLDLILLPVVLCFVEPFLFFIPKHMKNSHKHGIE